jgi:ketosteroid isomerase-like protein
MSNSGFIRKYFSAYENQDRKAVESLLSNDFVFTVNNGVENTSATVSGTATLICQSRSPAGRSRTKPKTRWIISCSR